MRDKSFSLDPFRKEQTIFSTKENIVELWHKKLGHYHYQGLLKMQKATWRATKKLQLIHIYVGGPLRTPSLKGSRYYIIFLDDSTRMC